MCIISGCYIFDLIFIQICTSRLKIVGYFNFVVYIRVARVTGQVYHPEVFIVIWLGYRSLERRIY